MSHNGTVGVQMRKVQRIGLSSGPIARLLVMHSDGVPARWSLGPYPGLHGRASGDHRRRCCIATSRAAATTPRWSVVAPMTRHSRSSPRRSHGATSSPRCSSAEPSSPRSTSELAETNQGVVALYAELDDNATQLREASELKSRFLSYMSHEFRTPLGVDPQHRADPARPAGRPADATSRRSRSSSSSRRRVELTEMVERPARPGQGRGRPGHDLAGLVRDGRPVLGAARHVQADPVVGCRVADLRGADRTFRGCTPTTRSCRRSCATSSPTR